MTAGFSGASGTASSTGSNPSRSLTDGHDRGGNGLVGRLFQKALFQELGLIGDGLPQVSFFFDQVGIVTLPRPVQPGLWHARLRSSRLRLQASGFRLPAPPYLCPLAPRPVLPAQLPDRLRRGRCPRRICARSARMASASRVGGLWHQAQPVSDRSPTADRPAPAQRRGKRQSGPPENSGSR